jgi:hypothetical protein
MTTEYKKYQHVEIIGSQETDGIEIGTCHIFPKIDGTNAKVWWCPNSLEIKCGSRNRELSLLKDNAGFMSWAIDNESLSKLSQHLQGYDIFGEWLVPHSLKTYRDESWRKFYVFDVRHKETGKYLTYEEYSELCEDYKVDYIAPIRIIKNPALDNIVKCLEQNNFLIKDGEGFGEGVVIKNYDFENQYGRVVWAKMVTSSFKEKHHKEMGAPITSGTSFIEEKIVEEFQSVEIMDKVMANIKSQDGWSSRRIPQLIHTIFYDLVRECTWDFVKKHKNPKIDFKILSRFSVAKTKDHFSI